MTQQHHSFKKPGGVSQVPFGGAGIGHGLHALVFSAQGAGQVQGVLANSAVMRRPCVSLGGHIRVQTGLHGDTIPQMPDTCMQCACRDFIAPVTGNSH